MAVEPGDQESKQVCPHCGGLMQSAAARRCWLCGGDIEVLPPPDDHRPPKVDESVAGMLGLTALLAIAMGAGIIGFVSMMGFLLKHWLF